VKSELTRNPPKDNRIWVWIAKWINFEKWYAFERQPIMDISSEPLGDVVGRIEAELA